LHRACFLFIVIYLLFYRDQELQIAKHYHRVTYIINHIPSTGFSDIVFFQSLIEYSFFIYIDFVAIIL